MNIISITDTNVCITDNISFFKISNAINTLNISYKKLYDHDHNEYSRYFCLPVDDIVDDKNNKEIIEWQTNILNKLIDTKKDEIPIKVKKRALHKHWKNIFENGKYQILKFHKMDGNISDYIDNFENIDNRNMSRLTVDDIENKLKKLVIHVIYSLSILEKVNLVHGDLHIKNVLYKEDEKDDVFMICDLDTLTTPLTMSWHASQPGWLEKRHISLLHKPLNSVYWDLYVFINSLHLTLSLKKKIVPKWVSILEKESLYHALNKRCDNKNSENNEQIINLIKLVR